MLLYELYLLTISVTTGWITLASSRTSNKQLSLLMYQPLGPCTARSWKHDHFTYLPNPPSHIIQKHKESMECREASNTHIIVCYLVQHSTHFTTSYTYSKNNNPHTMQLLEALIKHRPYAKQPKMP